MTNDPIRSVEVIHHPTHGFLPWAADRAQAEGLFHVAALIRNAMGRIDDLTAERDRLRYELEYAYRVVDCGFVNNTFDFSVLRKRAADHLKEQSK